MHSPTRGAFPPLDNTEAVYTGDDSSALAHQLRRSWIAAIVYACAAIALLIPTLVARSQIATIAVTIVMGGLGIFLWGIKITPVVGYARHIKEIHTGLSRETSGRLVRVDSEGITHREGVDCHAFVINVGGDPAHPDDPKDERLLYWDAQKPMPAWQPGDILRVTAHGNDVIALRVTRNHINIINDKEARV